MSRPTVTAAIITLNEEQNLPGLLAALDWADEMVVVDGGSRDSTEQIARAAGCRVEVRTFCNFAQQRNRALALARGDWVLSIDADERPGPLFVEELRDLVRSSHYQAYHVKIRSRIFGRAMRFSGTQDDQPVRLFRRGAARWSGDVHEVLEVHDPIGRMRQHLTHQTLPTLPAFLEKMHRYTTLEAQRRAAEGCPAKWRDRWIAPWMEVGRRLIWKQGALDGPEGWAFCLLSGLSAWVLANKHRQLWRRRQSSLKQPSAFPEPVQRIHQAARRATPRQMPREMEDV